MKPQDFVSYHLENKIPLHESVFRYGSDAYFDTFREARQQFNEGVLTDLHWFDAEILSETELGEWVNVQGVGRVPLDMPISEDVMQLHEAKYQGKTVELNKPRRGGSKKFYVYTRNPKTGKIIKVSFGAQGGGGSLAVKLKDPKARKNFASRHQCEKRNDKTKASYWSCRLPRYAKSLGLSGGGQWW